MIKPAGSKLGVGLSNSIIKIFRILRQEFLFKLNFWTIPAFLIGLFIYLLQNKSLSQDLIRYFLIIGILGSYTTFSAFSFETIDLLKNNKLLLSFIYIFSSLVLCLIAAYVGLNINKILN